MTPSMTEESSILITIVLATASVVAALAAWSMLWFNNKLHKQNGLLEFFKLLNERKHRV